MDAELSQPLYRQVAQHWITAISQGAVHTGDRLPSVRQLCEQHNISLSTAVAAYRWLEEQQWVEARPKSGYFVARRQQTLLEPKTQAPQDAAQFVGITKRVLRFLEATRQPGVLSLGAACPGPDLFPVTALQRLMTQVSKENPLTLSRYSMNTTGNSLLRAQIAKRAATYGLHLNSDDLVITYGCTEAINLALRAVAKPGDTIALESPTYYGILQIIEAHGLKVLEIPTHPRDGISLEALELATRTPGAVAACLVVSNFNNPLGCVVPTEHKQRLVQLLSERQIPLIEDDIYGDLHQEGARPTVAKSWDKTGNVLLCSSFTKTLAPGFRIGWIAPGRYRKAIEMLKYQNNVCTMELPQLVIARYMESGSYDRHLRRLREQFRLQLACVSASVARHFPEGTRLSRPAGGFVLWVELPQPLTGRALFEAGVKQGIVIAPGDIFTTQGLYQHCIRINAGLPWTEAIAQGLQQLGELACVMHRNAMA